MPLAMQQRWRNALFQPREAFAVLFEFFADFPEFRRDIVQPLILKPRGSEDRRHQRQGDLHNRQQFRRDVHDFVVAHGGMRV